MTELVVTDDAKQRPARAPRSLVVVGVVVYCLIAWAALFQIVELGIGLFNHGDAHYAERASGND